MAERMITRANESGASGSAADKRRKTPAKASVKAGRRTAKKTPRSFGKKTIALVYDFDGTLSPRPMQEYAFLPTIGENASDFWNESNRIAAEQKADPMITYMHLLYKKAKARNVTINREALVRQGASVEFFPGVEQWFDLINAYVASRPDSQGVSIRHYLISSGLAEIVEGTSIYENFHNVFASEYWFEAYELPYPKRVITDTGKTQYLFRINKGIEDLGESINDHMPETERPVPFSNMIYFGDGDTDVPSMAVTRKNGGYAMAVHPPGNAKKKCTKLFEAGRCDFYAVADYRDGKELYKRTCLLLDRMLADIRVREEMWDLSRS
ncbi:MAG: haloacid dehalogenase-like hydrolase [Hyphomicrobiaceae bacterium]